MNLTNEDVGGKVVERLTGVLWAGVQRDSLDALVDLQDLLAALILLQPDAERLSVVIAWWHVRNRSWAEALRELRRAEYAGSILPLGVALTAVCLYALEDAAWHTYACAAAWQSEDPRASQIARALLAGAGCHAGAGAAEVAGTRN
jgi:type III secretion protein HrpB1